MVRQWLRGLVGGRLAGILMTALVLSSRAALVSAQEAGAGGGQVPGTAAASAEWMRPLFVIGSSDEDRWRLEQLVGRAGTERFLVRSASTQASPLPPPGFPGVPQSQLIQPAVRAVWNSAIPFSLNEGAMWAGRGLNLSVTSGVRLGIGRVTLALIPELIHQQNLSFDFIPYSSRDRSPFAAPWHTFPESIDLPMRFGPRATTSLGLGQSSVSVRIGPLAVGASSESQWWGPGIRNAILMSNHAPGIPHLFLRPDRPIRTGIGDFWGRWMVGGLVESSYFDRDRSNDVRSLSALAVTFTPAGMPDLTVGLARSVYAPVGGLLSTPPRAFDVFTRFERPNARPRNDLEREPGPDQIISLFGRWVFPDDGFEAYVEWARIELPASLRDMLVAPHHSQGYTLGLQWARTLRADDILRLQGEVTYLEQSSTFRQRRVTTFYTSRPVLQGYTHRGQVIGASIGPGASSQWLAGDYVAPNWRVGLFAGRIRWENDAHYSARQQPFLLGHDVSVFAGLRAGHSLAGFDLMLEYTGATRFNYLFQYLSTGMEDIRGMDLRNHTLGVSVTPRRR